MKTKVRSFMKRKKITTTHYSDPVMMIESPDGIKAIYDALDHCHASLMETLYNASREIQTLREKVKRLEEAKK